MADEVKLMDEMFQPKLAPTERRVKVLPVPENLVLELLYLLQGDTPQFVIVPRMSNLPEGTKIEQVVYDPMRRAFLFLLSHPSFEIVPEGEYSPSVEEHLRTHYTVVEIDRLPKKSPSSIEDAKSLYQMGVDLPKDSLYPKDWSGNPLPPGSVTSNGTVVDNEHNRKLYAEACEAKKKHDAAKGEVS